MNDDPSDPTEAATVSVDVTALRDGEMHVVRLPSGRKAMVFRSGEQVSVFSEICPHMGADLTKGRVCGPARTLECPWHGYLFSTETGAMLKNPNEDTMTLLRVRTKHFDPGKRPQYKLRALKWAREGSRVVITEGRAVRSEA